MQLRPHQENIIETMTTNCKGQIIVPTGGGKTMCMIEDAKRIFNEGNPSTIVVVAPRILLAHQLCSEFLEHIVDACVLHVHSGHAGSHHSTTKPDKITAFSYQFRERNRLIFTTYNSLHRIQEAGINVNTIYFDEAHNSVARNFFPAVQFYSSLGGIRCYFFTATPKHSLTVSRIGMNDEIVYGKVLAQVPAPELVDSGYILPPKVVVKQLEMRQTKDNKYQQDADDLLATIDEQNVGNVLICARRTTQIMMLTSETDFCAKLEERGFNWMHITSKHGAIINGKKVPRATFFKTLNKWGNDDNQKFVVMHHSILAEGINVHGLEAVLFMRNMDYITMSQTIGRVIRKGNEQKQFGIVCTPVYDRVGISTSKRLQAVVDIIFEKGEPAISVIRR